MSYREEALGSARTDSAANPGGPRFWLTGMAFLAAYLALNAITTRYQFKAVGITLWSPDDGLAVLLLTEAARFFPFVLAGAVLADVLISHVHHSFYVTVLAESASTLGYLGLATALRDVLKFSLRRTDLANVLVMLAAVPAGAILNSLIYCGVLYLAGSLPGDQFVTGLRHFWIGDAVGIIAVLAAATAMFAVSSRTHWVWRRDDTLNWSVFLVSSCLAFAFIHGARERLRLSFVLSVVLADHLDRHASRL